MNSVSKKVDKVSMGRIMVPMQCYTKLFHSILASTIWREDDKTRIVWITLLAMTNKDGIAYGSIPGLADLARVSVEDCEAALAKLKSPDKYSRSKEYDGRRIEDVDGGWQVLNHAKYRKEGKSAERTEYNRVKKREERELKKLSAKSAKVSTCPQKSAHTDTDADTDTKQVDLDLQVEELKSLYGELLPDTKPDLDNFNAAFRKLITMSGDFPAVKSALPVVIKSMLDSGWAKTHKPSAVLEPKWFWSEFEVAGGRE